MTQNQRKTVAATEYCFTPGFLGIILRAFEGHPPHGFVDIDIFSNTQMGLVDFEMGETTINGKEATVHLTLWGGRGKPGARAARQGNTMQKVTVYLTDVGDGEGFQVRDFEFAPRKDYPKTFRIREWLERINKGGQAGGSDRGSVAAGRFGDGGWKAVPLGRVTAKLVSRRKSPASR